MSAHTPGPLHVEKHNGEYEIWPKDSGQTHTNVGTARTKADATLFAAAPELLAACKAAEENLSPAYCGEHIVMKLLRAAIAKAESNTVTQ